MKRILKIIGLLLAVLVVCFLILLLVLTITEYRPADLETLKITGDVDDAVQKGQTLEVRLTLGNPHNNGSLLLFGAAVC